MGRPTVPVAALAALPRGIPPNRSPASDGRYTHPGPAPDLYLPAVCSAGGAGVIMTVPVRLGVWVCALVLAVGGVAGAARWVGADLGADDLAWLIRESERREVLSRQ